MLNPYNYHDTLKNVIGSTLIEAQYQIYVFKDVEATVISVKMIFANGKHITVQCASDGESLYISQDTPEVADLEDFGHIELLEISKFDPARLADCKGQAIKCIALQIRNNMPKSLWMDCDGHKVFFSNVGDVLNFEETHFKRMISEQGWTALTSVFFGFDDQKLPDS